MIKAMLYGVLGFGLAASLTEVGYYAGQASTSNPEASHRDPKSAQAAPAKPKSDDATAPIVGVWAFADSGCATGYGAGYSADGRFSEGDEFGGVEGRWTLNDGQLIRKTTLRYELDEAAAPDAPPAVIAIHQTNRFPVIRLTSNELVIDDHGKRFSYVACADGKRSFMDGKKIGPA